MRGLSEIQRQILWSRLIAVVEEQAQALVRTAFSTSTREAGDLSAGVFDENGLMIAQAVTGTPGHVNSMARSVGHFLARFPAATMRDGDVFVTNDPWLGTGHLNDIVVVTPVFRNGAPVAFFAATVHVVDIGGRGTPIESRQVFEEGLLVPISRLVDAGAIVEPLLELIAANVRDPVALRGDLYSLIAGNETGGRQLLRLMDEYGLDTLAEVAAFIFERSRAASIAAIRALPAGRWTHDVTADGVDQPIRLVATLSIGEDGIDIDFAGTDGPSPYAINVPFCYTEAYASFGAKCVVAPAVPNNAASLATIRVSAPVGSILNVARPAPVVSRHILGQLLPDLVIGCLAQVPGLDLPAESAAPLWPVVLTGGPGRVEAPAATLADATPFVVASFHSGGTGARPRADGLSATAFPSGVRNVPVEVTEAVSPVVFWRKEYITDSGGPGAQRGGLGQVLEIASSEAKPFAINASFDRTAHPPRGRAGGGPGGAGRLVLDDGTPLTGKGHQAIPAGRRLLLEMPGGGGHGDPRRRDRSRIAEDLADGLVSAEAAKTVYGFEGE
ncbi:hydantoinase B/oxoprolinase family protein [Prosthecomicrobium pneumaticum]|uniref:N-methylhydantoinase B n=1 Tax=Prosthecomicrobium pneumaticum TaxID=81895 RepID=A0A7W9CU81_9HYPH|nr:hydantoinase B/oxoprolinase family protein [Prosthecomicrobium pneumaticum]MBB5751626.1 N-methylhydantoinase B [Prosthecomicrobium pneumaticum]